MAQRKFRRILVDGDIVIHRAAAAAEVEVDWGDDIRSIQSDLQRAQQLIDIDLGETLRKFGGRLLVALSHPECWRKRIFPEYKAHRTQRKPMGYKELVTYVKSGYPTECWPGLEADDVLGILATNPKNSTKPLIVSVDKDLRTVPGWVVSGHMDTPTRISEEQADRNHLKMTLVGDAADGFKGCPGVGPVGAEKVLDAPGDTWENVVARYEKAGLTTEDALTQARVSRILRWGDYTPQTGTADYKVKLWEPHGRE